MIYQSNLRSVVLVVYDYDEFGNVVSEEDIVSVYSGFHGHGGYFDEEHQDNTIDIINKYLD